jgi:hypothetical protein
VTLSSLSFVAHFGTGPLIVSTTGQLRAAAAAISASYSPQL